MQTYSHNNDIKEFQGVLVSCHVNASFHLCVSMGIDIMGLTINEGVSR